MSSVARLSLQGRVAEGAIIPSYGIAVTAQVSALAGATAAGLTINGPTQTNTMFDGALLYAHMAGTFATGQGVYFRVQSRDEYADTFTSIFTSAQITSATDLRIWVQPSALIQPANTATTAVIPLGREWRAGYLMTTSDTTVTALSLSSSFTYLGQGRIGGGL